MVAKSVFAFFFSSSSDNLKDLQRFLRRDDPQRREVFKQVCKWKIASRDLVPIIENYQADRNLVITAGKLVFFFFFFVFASSISERSHNEFGSNNLPGSLSHMLIENG